MRQAEARAFRRESSYSYMRRAGKAVADLVEQRFAQKATRPLRVVVACGKGNNGGDGYIAAQKLATRGFDVRVLALGENNESRTPDARRANEHCGLKRIGLEELDAFLERERRENILLIDAMVGIGLTSPLRGMALEVAELFNRARRQGGSVLAVDLPSGLYSDRPCVEQGGVVEADLTLCFFRKKAAHVLLPSRVFCGEILCDDIGFLEEDCPDSGVVENAPALFSEAVFCKPLDAQTHKHRRGSVVVVRSRMGGAARLAAEGATRSGVGLVRLFSDAAESYEYSPLSGLPASVIEEDGDWQQVVRGVVQQASDEQREKMVFAYGFGAPMSEQTLGVVRKLTGLGLGLVLDAGALRSMGGGDALSVFASFKSPVVLLPHGGEFRALFSCDQGLLGEEDPLERARRAARLSRAVVVVKGGDTIVAAPDGRLSVLTESSPCLATAGSGDVLAGFVAGLLAVGGDAFLAASAAVWLHGRAGMALEKTWGRGMRADDLAGAMAAAFARGLSCD